MASYKQQQNAYDKEPALRFSSKNGEVKDLADLLYKFFVRKFQTYNVNTLGDQQCTSGRSRSIQDAYLLAKTYFPEITVEKIAKAVKSLYGNKDGGRLLVHSFCSTVQRTVHDPTSCMTDKTEIEAVFKKKNIENLKAVSPKAHLQIVKELKKRSKKE